MKKINFNLAKRLNELGLLDNINTEYAYNKSWWLWDPFYKKRYIYKTLTTEEALEFLPDNIVWIYWALFNLVIDKNKDWYLIDYKNNKHWYWYIKWWKYFENNNTRLTLIEAIEQMIEFLIDNNLLWQQ